MSYSVKYAQAGIEEKEIAERPSTCWAGLLFPKHKWFSFAKFETASFIQRQYFICVNPVFRVLHPGHTET